jgi:hypothetical protein
MSAEEAAGMVKKSLAALTFAAALGGFVLTPAIGQAQGSEPRMYDRAHKDYHNWNTEEDRMYRQYLTEHHHKYREFQRMSKKQQNEYWKWRHNHEGR